MVISLPFTNIWEVFAIGRWELTVVSLQLFSFENQYLLEIIEE